MNASWKSWAPLAVVAGLAVVALVNVARWQPARAERQAGAGRQGNPEAEAAIQKQAEAFVEGFHKGDAKAVAAFWTADGDYTDQTGKHLKGREAIEKAFQNYFSEHKGLKLRINSDSLLFSRGSCWGKRPRTVNGRNSMRAKASRAAATTLPVTL
jgi:hypothetical protein